MPRTCKRWRGVLALGLLSAVLAPAQDTWNSAVGATLSGCLAPGAGQKVIVAASLLDVAPPAIPAGQDSRSWVAWLADRAPRANGESGGASISAVLKIALENHESALPDRTADEVLAIRRARKILTRRRPWILAIFAGWGPVRPSRKLAAYRTYAKDYRSAEDALKAATSPADQARAASRLKDAGDAWTALGYKTEIEEALDDLNMEAAGDPQAHWATAGQTFSSASQAGPNGSRYLPVIETPGYQDWFSEINWKHCASGGVSLDVKVVALHRAWLDLDVLTSHSWRWLKGTPYRTAIVADGAGGGSGLLPWIADSLLLFRNLTVNLPPGVHLTATATRLGGWIARPLPKTPDPDPALLWPTEKSRRTGPAEQ